MSLFKEAEAFVDSWGEGYNFWGLALWVCQQPGGHVIIRPDFVAMASEDGEAINVWLAFGPDGVRKAMELAPPSAKIARWIRGTKDKQIRTYSLDQIRKHYGRHSRRITPTGDDTDLQSVEAAESLQAEGNLRDNPSWTLSGQEEG